MTLPPLLSSLQRNKVGVALIGLQIAVTLAILCNALFVVEQRLSLAARPSGTDEADLFAVTNEWVSSKGDGAGRVRNDLAALRALPGVAGAYATNSYPLSGGGDDGVVTLKPTPGSAAAQAAHYFADQDTLKTLGLRLVAGRNFTATDVTNLSQLSDLTLPDGVIITQALAKQLFPNGGALGQRLYFDGPSAPIVGIVARLQSPFVGGGFGSNFVNNSILMPVLDDNANEYYYVVRARAGQLAPVMKAARQKLLQLDPERVIARIQPFSAARADIYRLDRGLAVILTIVCAVLLVLTAAGIVGLTSYWVAQRRRQIGIRRALGATRLAVLRHFHAENLLIAVAGGIVGVGLGLAANVWMIGHYQMPRMPLAYLIAGWAAVLAIGQLAVFWPALRAASIPPALATRAA